MACRHICSTLNSRNASRGFFLRLKIVINNNKNLMATRASWHNQDITGTSGWVPCVVFQTPKLRTVHNIACAVHS